MIKINDKMFPSKDTSIKKTLLGVNVIETSVKTDIKIGDIVNDWYHVKQINSKKGDYTSITAEHEIYKLINIVYQSPDNYFSQFSYANVRLEELIGSESLLQQLIPYNIVINNDVNLDAKRDIDFQDDNCLSALQKIAERFNIEFIPRINGTNMEIVIADIIGNTIPQVNVIDGINSVNVSKSVDSKDVVTRVFPNGSTSGLPINYSYNNLKPNKFYAYANPDLLEYPFHGKFDDAAATFTGKIVVAEDSAIPETQLSLSGVAFNTNFTINTETTIITINGFPSDTNQLAKLKLLTADNKLIKDIYVSQVNQKIFFNDIKWNASTPQFFIEDNTIPSHPIEKSITFSEIQPKLISGQINNFAPSVSGSWAITVTPELIANVDLSEVHKQKARVAFYDYSTMFSGDGFIIDSIDYTNGILYIYPPKEEETDKLRKNDSWLISTGDVSNKNFTFTLTDYIHVQQVNEACQAVLEQGEQYLIQHKNPQITYTIDRLKTNELNIGDTVRIVDGTRPLKIDSLTITGDDNIDLSFAIDGVEVSSLEVGQTIQKVLRITLTNNTSLLRSGFLEVKINGETFLTHNYSVNPNEYEKVYGYVGEIVRIMEYAYDGVEYTNLVLQNFNRFKAYAYNQKEATIADIYNAKDALKIDVQQAALKAKFQEEQWRLLIDSNFYGDYTLTEGIRIGSEDRNFIISGLSFDEGETGDNFVWNKVSWTSFDFSMAINPNVTVSIPSGSSTGLLASNYFIYVKIEEGTEQITPDIKVDPSSVNNTIFLTQTKKASTYDSGYYYFAIGVVKLQDSAPKLYSLSYGMTYIDGGLIKTKTLEADMIMYNDTLTIQAKMDDIISDLTDIVSDNKLTPDEKKTLRNEWQAIQNEYTSITNQASTYSVDSTDYTTKYNALSTYLTSLNLTTDTTEDIDRTVFLQKFNDYYSVRGTILDNITSTAENRIGLTEDQLTDISDDGKVTPNEKQQLKQEWESIKKGKIHLDNMITSYNISSAKQTTLNNAYDSLKSALEPNTGTGILTDMTTTTILSELTTPLTRNEFIALFSTYYDAADAVLEDSSIKSSENIGDKLLYSGNSTDGYAHRFGKSALPNNLGDGLWMQNGKLLLGNDLNSDKYLYYDGTNFILKGGILEATNAFLWTDTNIEVTVGTNGDFATLNEALEYMSKFMIIKRADNTKLTGNINILTGYQETESLEFYNVDLSWVTITSQDTEVLVNRPNGTRFLRAEFSKLPTFKILFNMNNGHFYDSISDSFCFVHLLNSTVKFERVLSPNYVEPGFYNFDTNEANYFEVYENSQVFANFATFNNISGIIVENSKWISYSVDVKNSYRGFIFRNSSFGDITSTNFDGTNNGYNVFAEKASVVNASNCYFADFSSQPQSNVGIIEGSFISIYNSYNAKPTRTVNTLSSQGVIFSD